MKRLCLTRSPWPDSPVQGFSLEQITSYPLPKELTAAAVAYHIT